MSKTKTNWEKLANNIPTKVEVAPRTFYEVLRAEEIISGEDVLGETRFDPKQIVLKVGQTPKEEFGTFFHEFLHAASHEYDIGLTESQVRKLEKAYIYAKKKGLF